MRGFDRSRKHREWSAAGGRAAHAGGEAHRFTSATARAAGRKGGIASRDAGEDYKALGRKGGRASAKRRAELVDNDASTEGGAS